MTRTEKDDLVFADEDTARPLEAGGEPWKMLIADDDEEIHQVTKLALANFTLGDRPIRFLDAYSGREAVGAMVEHPDIALVLMDVVMETEDAGLAAVDAIRNRLGNRITRIVLRTGQPGQAPERDVVIRYDINDYKEKTELTAKKLFTLVYTSLTLYSDMVAARKTRDGLERIIGASSTIFRRRLPQRLGKGALNLLASILGIDQASGRFGAVIILNFDKARPEILAGAGRYDALDGKPANASGVPDAMTRIRDIRRDHTWALASRQFAARIDGPKEAQLGIYLDSDTTILPIDSHVLDIFCRNVSLALHSAQMNQELDRTQSELIVMLGEAIEKRSKETGNHVRRVGEYSRLLGRLHGLSEEEADTLLIAAALHDAGKIAIPDAILMKPGKLTAEERRVMETHAQIGSDIFANHDMPVLQSAMTIAAQHHERWDGLGYPRKLKGEQIHLYGRITALTDVFDALGSHRCYKKAWPLEDVLQAIREENGRHFEPALVDLFMENLPKFLEIRDRHPDPAPPP